MTEQHKIDRCKESARELMASAEPHRGAVLVVDEALRDYLDETDPLFVRWGGFLERLGMEEQALEEYGKRQERRVLWRARREFADHLEELAGLVRKGEVFACGFVAVRDGHSMMNDFSDSPEQLLWLVSGLRHLGRELDDVLYPKRRPAKGAE